jgi:hypothetical protein
MYKVYRIARTALLFALLLGVSIHSISWAADYRALVGIWRSTSWVDLTGAPGRVELVIQPNGNYSRLAQSQSGFQLYIAGTWQVLENYTMLRLNIHNYEPRQWCGPLGCNPIYLPAGETLSFELKQNFLRTQTVPCQPGLCETIVYQRAGR